MDRFEHGGGIYDKIITLDFSVNTNPLGIDERIKRAVKEAEEFYGVYPDIKYTKLRRAIAEYENVHEENIVCSNGAAEMIFALTRAIRPRRALLIAPSFSEYERALLAFGCDIEYYELREENGFAVSGDITDRLDGKNIAFICNPNNPTGMLIDKKIMDMIISKCGRDDIICAVDECFMELAGGYSVKGHLPVIKAFTKTYAMAGLRLGYLIADERLAREAAGQLPAWNVSSLAQAAGIKALECGDYLKDSVEVIKNEREYLSAELTRLGFRVFKSDANFILFKGDEGIGCRLIKKGILIRECGNFRELDSHFYRIAVKTHKENEILIKELEDIYG